MSVITDLTNDLVGVHVEERLAMGIVERGVRELNSRRYKVEDYIDILYTQIMQRAKLKTAYKNFRRALANGYTNSLVFLPFHATKRDTINHEFIIVTPNKSAKYFDVGIFVLKETGEFRFNRINFKIGYHAVMRVIMRSKLRSLDKALAEIVYKSAEIATISTYLSQYKIQDLTLAVRSPNGFSLIRHYEGTRCHIVSWCAIHTQAKNQIVVNSIAHAISTIADYSNKTPIEVMMESSGLSHEDAVESYKQLLDAEKLGAVADILFDKPLGTTIGTYGSPDGMFYVPLLPEKTVNTKSKKAKRKKR